MEREDLIEKAVNGDVAAFEQLIEPYMQKAYNIALGVTANPHEAEDAAQEALIKAYNSIGNFSGNSSFYTWLYRIVYNCALDMLRKKHRSPLGLFALHSSENEDEEIPIVDDRPLPEESVIKGELCHEVRRALSMLKESYRIVVVLRDMEGLNYEEIANILDISEGTVKSRIHRGRESLKNIIIQKFPELFENFNV